MNKKRIITIGVVLGALSLLCFIVFSNLSEANVRVGYLGTSYGNTQSASFSYFDGINTRKVNFDKGDEITINYSIELKKGTLQVRLEDQEGQEVFSKSEGSGVETITVNETQTYLIKITASKAEGKYSLSWNKSN